MRFIADGPDIPDDLLIARDEGRVVFFCGSGISKARANLPDFFGLANTVIKQLGTAQDSPAYKLLNAAPLLKEQTGIDNLVSADRIFGLLEREFLPTDIRNAVASALMPKPDVDLSAHKIILDLATNDGKVKLITTNFDRLFDQCNPKLPIYQPPRLPDITNNEEIDGIVYLHGCSNTDYTSAEGNGFVLSSSEFGGAYLADGWATRFYKAIIEKYVVVFIGYSADDPPVQYLLEAFNKKSGQFKDVYAFQVGDKMDAISKWAHKGIQAIPYHADEAHSALWDTLSAWAVRSHNPQKWYESKIEMASSGPAGLKPHERGQIAHIVSSTEGAKLFAKSEPPPPAEWLCVFDPTKRLEKPGKVGPYDARELYIPFDQYGLDSDDIPEEPKEIKLNREEDPLNTPWNCFSPNKNDLKESSQPNYSYLKGNWSLRPASLLPRLHQILLWISKVSHQPCAVWWASFQAGLHPDFIGMRDWNFNNRKDEQSKLVRQAWYYLEEAWKSSEDFDGRSLYSLKNVVDDSGWDHSLLRAYVELHKPHIKVRHNYWRGPKPPNKNEHLLSEMLLLEVVYIKNNFRVEVPDEWLPATIGMHRKNLELAVQLENEINNYGITGLAPINVEDDEEHAYSRHIRTEGLSGYIILFSELFERFVSINTIAARQEFHKWSLFDDAVFCKLKIWAAGLPDFLSPIEFSNTFLQISDRAFWDSQHQRDLLISLKSRWNHLPDKIKKTFEKRLLKGPRERYSDESKKAFRNRAAWGILSRVNWLNDHGCKFTFNIDDMNIALERKAPDWNPQYAKRAAESSVGRGGFVRTENNYDVLLNIPISEILKTASENNGRTEDFLVQKDPFSGLCKKMPLRAFHALEHAAMSRDFPEWAWATFLNSESRSKDRNGFIKLIALRICNYPDNALHAVVYIFASWFERIGEKLGAISPEMFDELMLKFIRIINKNSLSAGSKIVRGDNEIDWLTEAINAPIGKLAELLTRNPVFGTLEAGKGLPANWKLYAESLLSTKGDLRRYVISILNFNIRWFYAIDQSWVEKHLITVLQSKNPLDIDAFWSGLLGGTRYHSIELYRRLKPNIMELAKSTSGIKKSESEVIASILLSGWITIDNTTNNRFINSQELREVILTSNEDFRSALLWQLKGWVRPKTDSEFEDDSMDLSDELVHFFKEVWPLQKSARTPIISARLYDLAFSCRSNFSAMVEVILPLVTQLQKNSHIHLDTQTGDNVFSNYPEEALTLLYKALPTDVTAWPYDVDSALKKIEESKPALANDRRLVELFRLWNSR